MLSQGKQCKGKKGKKEKKNDKIENKKRAKTENFLGVTGIPCLLTPPNLPIIQNNPFSFHERDISHNIFVWKAINRVYLERLYWKIIRYTDLIKPCIHASSITTQIVFRIVYSYKSDKRTKMDIHRCRFVDYNPSAIHALAFSHPLSQNTQTLRIPASLRLAIGRANGSIEIWNPQLNWFHESTLHGGIGRSIEGLVWTQEEHHSVKNGTIGRLFSIGYSTVVTEWNLSTGKPLKHFDCNKGVIWSIAAQPKREPGSTGSLGETSEAEDVADGQQLVVGCEDGSLVVISTEGGPGSMNFVRIIQQSRAARVLSLAYQTPHLVVAGLSDSKLRVFDTRSGRTTATMSVGQNAGQKDVHIWRVKCLPGAGNWIIAGDSRGEVTFWDGKRYALRQRVKGHDADIMTLETNSKGTQVFSSGIDRRTVMYELVGKKMSREWVEISARKYHKHDVLAMASFEAGNMSVIVSGGRYSTFLIDKKHKLILRRSGYDTNYPSAKELDQGIPSNTTCYTPKVSYLYCCNRSSSGCSFRERGQNMEDR